jgi:phosphopantetheinyl transferase (holo-ACP synthase)
MTTTLQPVTHAWQRFESVVECDELRGRFDLDTVHWLSFAEQAELDRLRHAGRRASWLCGRLVGKELVRLALQSSCDLSAISISSRNDRGESVRPRVTVHGEAMECSLSISHHERLIVGCLETSPGTSVGIDVVSHHNVTPGFVETWFTPHERDCLEAAGEHGACLFWAAKEAVYKAVNDGERFAPRKIEISRNATGALMARYGGRVLPCEFERRTVGENIIVIATCRSHARNDQ